MPSRPRTTTARPKKTTARSTAAKKPTKRASNRVRIAAARAVEQVLSSKEAFALMMRKLEEAGFRVERAPGESSSHAGRGEL